MECPSVFCTELTPHTPKVEAEVSWAINCGSRLEAANAMWERKLSFPGEWVTPLASEGLRGWLAA